MNSSQQEVFEATCGALPDKVLQGIHGTVFAYGATGSGKTYSMAGQSDNPGVIPQVVNRLFDRIDSIDPPSTFLRPVCFAVKSDLRPL